MKKLFIIITCVLVSYQVFSQANIGFFHLNNATPQNNNYNAAAFPESRVFVSLPAISGVDLVINNSFGLTDVFTTTGDSTLIDIDRFLANQKDKSYLNASVGLTDFMFGYRLDDRSFFTLFVNERVDGTVFYPIKLMNFLWEGNGAYVGQNYAIDDISYDFTHYREWGIGYGRSFNVFGCNTNVGVRLKYLTGVFHSSIKNNLSVSILTREEDYSLEVTLDDGQVRSAGLDMISDVSDYGYFIFNQNRGVGLDLGVQMDVTDKLTLGLAVNDLGFVTWREQTEVTAFNGVSFSYEGMDLDNIGRFADALKDSIESLDVDTTATKFTTWLNSKSFLTGSYRVTENGYAQATVSNYVTQGQMKPAFGVGYLQNLGRWFAASVSATAAPQRSVDLGAGLMLRGGFFQTYVSVDNIINTINIPEASGVNIKFGINFLFGKRPEPKKQKKEDIIRLEDYYQFQEEHEKYIPEEEDQDQ